MSNPSSGPNHVFGAPLRAPVQAGDQFLLDPRLTGRSQPVWAEVDLVGWFLPELILGGDAGHHPWKVGYRIRTADAHADQLGVVWLDDQGGDDAHLVLDLLRS